MSESYHEEQERKAATCERIARTVAPLLGGGWEYFQEGDIDGPRSRRSYIVNPSKEARIFVSTVWNKAGRVHFAGIYPRVNGSYYGPSNGKADISVADSKPSQTIAKDVMRRLLPEYLPALATGLERMRADNVAADVSSEVAHRLGALVGTEPRQQQKGDDWRLYVGGASLKVGYNGSVRFDYLTCSASLAEELVKVIMAHQERETVDA